MKSLPRITKKPQVVNITDANERLLELRQLVKSQNTPRTPHSLNLDLLPKHLGWGSDNLTRILRRGSVDGGDRPTPEPEFVERAGPDRPAPQPTPVDPKIHDVRVYPSLMAGILQNELAAPGRIWLLCQHLDTSGRGWLSIDEVRKQLTGKESTLRVVGWRRLRQILKVGENIFWTRDGQDRLWLRGSARVAASLGIAKITGRAVLLPLKTLLGSLSQARAHFYASFHSGRPQSNPISRATLEKLTGVSPRTQQRYDKQARVRSVSNYSIEAVYTSENIQEKSYQHGHATFEFYDNDGQQGKKGKTYIARQMGNSYHSAHQQAARGRQKKINSQLDLVNRQARGNGDGLRRFYYTNPVMAAKAGERNQQTTYWPQTTKQRHNIWRPIFFEYGRK